MSLLTAHSHRIAGYTLVEVVISLAIIGFTSVLLVTGFVGPNRNERFGGEVKEFANYIKEAQVKAFTVETTVCPDGAGTCYGRGNVLEFDANGAALRYLYGSDLSQYTQNLNQRQGLSQKSAQISAYNLSGKGIKITDIKFIANGVTTSLNTASIAFLAPDGRSFLSNSIVASPFTVSEPYNLAGQIQFTLKDDGVSLTGLVTYDTASGTITSRVQ